MSNVHLPKIMADDQPRGDVSGLRGILETQERLPCEWRDGNEAPPWKWSGKSGPKIREWREHGYIEKLLKLNTNENIDFCPGILSAIP